MLHEIQFGKMRPFIPNYNQHKNTEALRKDKDVLSQRERKMFDWIKKRRIQSSPRRLIDVKLREELPTQTVLEQKETIERLVGKRPHSPGRVIRECVAAEERARIEEEQAQREEEFKMERAQAEQEKRERAWREKVAEEKRLLEQKMQDNLEEQQKLDSDLKNKFADQKLEKINDRRRRNSEMQLRQANDKNQKSKTRNLSPKLDQKKQKVEKTENPEPVVPKPILVEKEVNANLSDEEFEGQTYLQKRAKLVQDYQRIRWQLEKLEENDRSIAEDLEVQRWTNLTKEERWNELMNAEYENFIKESKTDETRQELIEESKKQTKKMFDDWDLDA